MCKGIEVHDISTKSRIIILAFFNLHHIHINMKHRKLHSVAHNLAGSIAGGASFIIGYCFIDIFAEAACQKEGAMTVDFLEGSITEGQASEYMKGMIPEFSSALPDFCEKHHVSISDFREFTVRYICDGEKRNFIVTIRDKNNRSSSREYIGQSGQRVKEMDQLGRMRSVKLLKTVQIS